MNAWLKLMLVQRSTKCLKVRQFKTCLLAHLLNLKAHLLNKLFWFSENSL